MLKREKYLEKLKMWKDKDLIKVLTGIRRCGKSTIFDLFINYLKTIGIDDNHIININFENPDNDFKDYKELYTYVKNKIKDNEKYYIFLDEIQNISDFEKAVDGLYIIKNIDLYITGSNAFLLSGELATLLSGRYIEIKIYPLSFNEYLNYFNVDVDEKIYLKYVNQSSFPYALNLEDAQQIDEYLDALYNTIIIKDVSKRKNIQDISLLKTISKFMFNNIGNNLSIKKIADTLVSDGRSISVHTVQSYLDALVDSYIFNQVSRFDIKGKQYLQSGEKYYATDVTMRYAILRKKKY